MYNSDKNCVSESYDRLAKILKNDKIHMPKMIENCLRQDIVRVVSSYFNIKDINTSLRVEIADSGEILITFEGVADSFKARKN